eukprot:2881351-Rhodomonas_salina.1
MDVANRRLAVLSPEIQLYGVEKEREYFAKVQREGLGLEKTELLFKGVVQMAVESDKVSLGSLLDGDSASFEAVHRIAVLSLLVDALPLSMASCPETMFLDLHRLQMAQAEFHFDTLSAT